MLSLAVYYFAVYEEVIALEDAAWPFVLIFGVVWGVFVAFTIVGRAVRFFT